MVTTSQVSTVAGPRFLSYNTPTATNTVRARQTNEDVGPGPFPDTFPAQSVASFRFSCKGVHES